MDLNATPGSANANSYVTMDEADDYFSARPFATSWTGQTDDLVKEGALIMATRLIDSRACFNGTSSSSTQALRWPMTGMLSRNGFPIDSAVIPQPLKDATLEMALALLDSDVSLPNPAFVAGLRSISAGPVSLSFRDDYTLEEQAIGMNRFKTLPENVRLMLVPSWLCEVPLTGKRFMLESF
jgi:hypothetical protein